MTSLPMRKLPSTDWLAFGAGLLVLALQNHLWPGASLVALAVFAPSILREIGVLKDCDELTRQIMHRAGFHAALVAVLLVFLNYLAPRLGWPPETIMTGDRPFDGEMLRKPIVYTFLVSYLIQYWGARKGTFWILIGLAATALVSLYEFATVPAGDQLIMTLGVLAFIAIAVLLAFLVRARPRVGGVVLLGIWLFDLVSGFTGGMDAGATWLVVTRALLLGLILAVPGVALLRERVEEVTI